EKAAEEATRLGRGVSRLPLQIANPRLQLTNALIRLLKRMLLHEDRLHEHVGRIRDLLDGVPDQGLGLRILLRAAERAHAVEQTGNELSFLWGHRGLLAIGHGRHVGYVRRATRGAEPARRMVGATSCAIRRWRRAPQP